MLGGKSRSKKLLPALLPGADFYYGTLAATRSLGRAGVPVVVADGNLSAAACWSRYVQRRLVCPPTHQAEHFIDWLLSVGRDYGPHVLCPTNDDTAWLLSRYQDELSRYHCLYQAPESAVHAVLNKWRLFELSKEVGLDAPKTWLPKDEADLERVCETARFPVLVKPTTQVLFPARSKGTRVEKPEDLQRTYGCIAKEDYSDLLCRLHADITQPLIQEFLEKPPKGIYGISGFVDRDGRIAPVRGNLKVLERRKLLGVGLCFEKAPVTAEMIDKLTRLCRLAGYYGMLEVEFIDSPQGPALIDFNPRLYNQLAFDIDRGADFPLMLYHAALGDWARVHEVVEQGRQFDDATAGVFTHRFVFEVMLRSQTWSGARSKSEAQRWLDWYSRNRQRCTDAALHADDWVPGVVDSARLALHYVRHPRDFVRSIVLNH